MNSGSPSRWMRVSRQNKMMGRHGFGGTHPHTTMTHPPARVSPYGTGRSGPIYRTRRVLTPAVQIAHSHEVETNRTSSTLHTPNNFRCNVRKQNVNEVERTKGWLATLSNHTY